MNADGISTKVAPTKMVPASAVRQLASANSRRISKMLPIELTKGHSGLGFKITTDKAAGSNSPIYIYHVLRKGAAIEDGRLRAGDRILEVNGTSMTGKSHTDAVAILRNIPLGKTVQLLVSRHEVEETKTVEVESEVASKIDDHEAAIFNCRYVEIRNFEIALTNSHSAGLGVSVMGKSTSPGNKSVDLGIFIKSVIPGGAASEDGRLQTNDQLISINGISLLGISNSNAIETFRNAIAQHILLSNENGNAQRPKIPDSNDTNNKLQNYKENGLSRTTQKDLDILQKNTQGLPGCNLVIERMMGQGWLERNNNDTYGYGRKDKLLMSSLEEKSNYPATLSSSQGESMMIYNRNVKKTADSHPVTGNAVENLNIVPSGSQISEGIDFETIKPGHCYLTNSSYLLSLDESNPGFVRDGFGQQSMCEKSMHAQLDAHSTGSYQHSKKARQQKDKHRQSSKLDYTQEGGTEFNPKIISVTGGADGISTKVAPTKMVPASAVRQLASANSRRISKMLPIELTKADGISTKVATVTPTNNVPANWRSQLGANWRRITKMLTIELTKGHSGLGFSITTLNKLAGSNYPICISHVLRKGAAIEDGRLRAGDRILEVNGRPMTGKSPTDVDAILCNTPLGKTVKLVVCRHEVEETETETVEVESEVDGLFQINDQLVNINGISLLGMSNRNAMETLRNAIAQPMLLFNENGNAQRPKIPDSNDSNNKLQNYKENGLSRTTQKDLDILQKNTQGLPGCNLVIERMMGQGWLERNNNDTYGYGRKDKLLMSSLEEKSNYPPTLSSSQGESMMIKGGYNHNVKKTDDSHPVTRNAVENLNIVPSGSQLSLDESNPGFVRDGFGQQSMSEKSMHAQLDAHSTGTYQHSKKAREKDKHRQSSKLDYTQEGGTEFNPKIISVTGGAKSFLGYPKDPVNVASCTMTEILLPTKRLERQKCATCDFQSFDRKGFKEHLVIHKKKKNTYQCQECGLCFVTETTLCKHLLIIHKIRDTKKYLEDEGSNFMPDIEETEVYCHVCFQTFTKGIALKGHLRSHGMDYIRSIRSNAPR